jgi:hypothetical protein
VLTVDILCEIVSIEVGQVAKPVAECPERQKNHRGYDNTGESVDAVARRNPLVPKFKSYRTVLEGLLLTCVLERRCDLSPGFTLFEVL